MFARFARWAAREMGTSKALTLAAALCALWLSIGPLLGAHLTWRDMLVNNLPTMLTLLMVFLVQHTQNHHNDAVQIKLDELIRAVQGAHNVMVHLEELSPAELAKVKAKYQALAERVREAGCESHLATSTPFIDPLPQPSPDPTGSRGSSRNKAAPRRRRCRSASRA